jgi:DNA-binding Lrp family transcriptional regulator
MRSQAAAERVRRMEDACIITGYRVELRLEKLFPVTGIIPHERARGELHRWGAYGQKLDGCASPTASRVPIGTFSRSWCDPIADLDAILGQPAPLWRDDRLNRPHVKIAPVTDGARRLITIRLREHTELHWLALRYL